MTRRVSAQDCLKAHKQFHEKILEDGSTAKAWICFLCSWVIQRQPDETWRVVQVFYL